MTEYNKKNPIKKQNSNILNLQNVARSKNNSKLEALPINNVEI